MEKNEQKSQLQNRNHKEDLGLSFPNQNHINIQPQISFVFNLFNDRKNETLATSRKENGREVKGMGDSSSLFIRHIIYSLFVSGTN